MIRQLLLATGLVGFVLTGVSMNAHAASGAEPVDLMAVSADADSAVMGVSGHLASLAVSGAIATLAEPSSLACLDCLKESLPVHDPGMVMIIGCAFAALAVGALALLFLRLDRTAQSVLRSLWPAAQREGGRAISMAHPPPDLLALGISRT